MGVSVGVLVIKPAGAGVTPEMRMSVGVNVRVVFTGSMAYGPRPKINMINQMAPPRIPIANITAKVFDFRGSCGRRGVAIEGTGLGVLFLA